MPGGQPVNLTNSSGTEAGPDWSPDGTKIAFGRRPNQNSDADIWLMDADGGSPQRLLQALSSDESAPTWSPDGTKIAFTTDYPVDQG